MQIYADRNANFYVECILSDETKTMYNYTRIQFYYYILTQIMFFIIHITDHKLIFDFIAFHKFFPPGRVNHLHISDGIQN